MIQHTKKPLPYWLKVVIKNQKLYIQFLKTNPNNRQKELAEAHRFLKWLQKEVK